MKNLFQTSREIREKLNMNHCYMYPCIISNYETYLCVYMCTYVLYYMYVMMIGMLVLKLLLYEASVGSYRCYITTSAPVRSVPVRQLQRQY